MPLRAQPHNLKRTVVVLSLLAVTLAAVAALRMWFGVEFNWPPDAQIRDIRFKRLAIACIVGVALATSGVGLQALLRNPLAEPFILGLSTGAGVGVMVQNLIAQSQQAQLGSRHVGAMVGSLISMTIVYVAGRRRGVVDPLGLLLTGVVLSTINGAIIMFLAYTLGASVRDDVARWMMGHLNEGVAPGTVILIGMVTLGGVIVMYWQGRAMDAATFSDSEAMSLGVNVPWLRASLFIIAGVLAGGAVVLAGPVAFVGLICPHVARLLLGPSHRALLIGSAMLGAMLLLTADMTSIALRWSMNIGLLPLGIFTAALGGVAFLWMLRPHLGRGQN